MVPSEEGETKPMTGPPSVSGWRKWRYRLEWASVEVVRRAVPCLSRDAVLVLAEVAGRAIFFFDRQSRAVALENLQLAFPEKDAAWHRRVAKRSFALFARTMLDLFWAPRLNASEWARYNKMKPMSRYDETALLAKGGIWCTAHYGNFEWIALGMGWRGYGMTVVAQDFKNAAITPIFSELRGLSGHQLIASEGAMLRLLKNILRGGHSSFLSDLTIKPTQAATVVRAFGRPMSVTMLHAVLAQRTGRPIVLMLSLPQADGTYHLLQWEPWVAPKDMSPAQIAQALWDKLEPIIREHPEAWLWSYKHWRYLPHPTESPVPSYARYSKPFAAMMKRELGTDRL
jgi:Kdo2-lipid IVA lauroyltransferase/acyltransferase